MSSRCAPALHYKVSGIGRFRLPASQIEEKLGRPKGLPHFHFFRPGSLRKLISSPTSPGSRLGHGTPSFSARVFMAGPWVHSAVAEETMGEASAAARNLGALRVPSALGPWQLAQPRSAKTRSPRKGEPVGSK